MRNSVMIALLVMLAGALVLVVYWPILRSGVREVSVPTLDSEKRQTTLPEVATDPVPPGTLVFCADPHLPFKGPAESSHPGYVVEILGRIFGGEGFQVAYVNLSWSHCIEDAREGRISALAGAHAAEVPDFIFPQQTIGRSRPTFFVTRDQTWRYHQVDSLASIRLGVIQDRFYVQELNTYIDEHLGSDRILSVKGQDAQKRLLKALREKHIDAFVDNAPPLTDVIKIMGFDPEIIQTAGSIESALPLYIAFSPRRVDSEALARIFDLGLERLRTADKLAYILDGYGIQDWMATPPGKSKGN